MRVPRRLSVAPFETRRCKQVDPHLVGPHLPLRFTGMNSPAYRILDVNLNRLREALRVIEDHARFTLDDADSAAAAKHLRHSLREIVISLGTENLSRARDILGDVGRDARAPGELERREIGDVVGAAFGRAQESARSLCEYAKLVSPDVAIRAERIRHAAYELEQRVMLRGDARRRFRAAGLYVIITRALCRNDWLQTAEQALRGGAACLQLREKSLPDRELLDAARRLRDLTLQHGALFIMNDRPDIAVLSHADGVHLGQDDLAANDARRVAGAHLLIGKSTHTAEQFDAALWERPDYLAVGPMFQTATKPQPHVAGVETLRLVASRTALPIVAIGGIAAASAGAMIAAGASSVCVCSAVIGASDPAEAAAEISRAIAAAKATHEPADREPDDA